MGLSCSNCWLPSFLYLASLSLSCTVYCTFPFLLFYLSIKIHEFCLRDLISLFFEIYHHKLITFEEQLIDHSVQKARTHWVLIFYRECTLKDQVQLQAWMLLNGLGSQKDKATNSYIFQNWYIMMHLTEGNVFKNVGTFSFHSVYHKIQKGACLKALL